MTDGPAHTHHEAHPAVAHAHDRHAGHSVELFRTRFSLMAASAVIVAPNAQLRRAVVTGAVTP